MSQNTEFHQSFENQAALEDQGLVPKVNMGELSRNPLDGEQPQHSMQEVKKMDADNAAKDEQYLQSTEFAKNKTKLEQELNKVRTDTSFQTMTHLRQACNEIKQASQWNSHLDNIITDGLRQDRAAEFYLDNVLSKFNNIGRADGTEFLVDDCVADFKFLNEYGISVKRVVEEFDKAILQEQPNTFWSKKVTESIHKLREYF